MTIILSTFSILSLTGLTWLLNKRWHLKLCPICAGVAGTWLWLLFLHWLGFPINLLVPATLLGGSVVGLTYQGERHWPAARSPLLMKTLFLTIGFAAVFFLLSARWLEFSGTSAALFLVMLVFLRPSHHTVRERSAPHKTLREQLKRCC